MANPLKEKLRQLPILFAFLKMVRRRFEAIYKFFSKKASLRRLKREARRKPCRVVLGAGGVWDKGWIGTNIETLNIGSSEDWQRIFTPNSIDAMLAEHVLEHLTEAEAEVAIRLSHLYLREEGYFRVAVPDGLHPDAEYIEAVRPGGKLKGKHAHKQLFTYKSLRHLFENAGFKVIMREYFDESGIFHYADWDPNGGMIHRSKRFDQRNSSGELKYTSIILDAFRVHSPETMQIRRADA